MTTLFMTLAQLLETVANTRKRLLIIDMVSDFLKSLENTEVEPAVSMILGRPLPKSQENNLNVSWTTLTEILQSTAKVSSEVFAQAFSQTGDVGSAAQAVFESSGANRQAALFKKELTIYDVRRTLQSIADATGPGAHEKKERLTTSLLSQASPIEIKYLVKLLIGEMRTGLNEGLMQQAVSKAFEIPPATVQKATMTMGDIAETAAAAKLHGEKGLREANFKIFRPVTLMLCRTRTQFAQP